MGDYIPSPHRTPRERDVILAALDRDPAFLEEASRFNDIQRANTEQHYLNRDEKAKRLPRAFRNQMFDFFDLGYPVSFLIYSPEEEKYCGGFALYEDLKTGDRIRVTSEYHLNQVHKYTQPPSIMFGNARPLTLEALINRLSPRQNPFNNTNPYPNSYVVASGVTNRFRKVLDDRPHAAQYHDSYSQALVGKPSRKSPKNIKMFVFEPQEDDSISFEQLKEGLSGFDSYFDDTSALPSNEQKEMVESAQSHFTVLRNDERAPPIEYGDAAVFIATGSTMERACYLRDRIIAAGGNAKVVAISLDLPQIYEQHAEKFSTPLPDVCCVPEAVVTAQHEYLLNSGRLLEIDSLNEGLKSFLRTAGYAVFEQGVEPYLKMRVYEEFAGIAGEITRKIEGKFPGKRYNYLSEGRDREVWESCHKLKCVFSVPYSQMFSGTTQHRALGAFGNPDACIVDGRLQLKFDPQDVVPEVVEYARKMAFAYNRHLRLEVK